MSVREDMREMLDKSQQEWEETPVAENDIISLTRTAKGHVGVKMPVKMRYVEEPEGHYACRFIALGLTARGETTITAFERCSQLFDKFVESYSSVGLLEDRLNRAGLDWKYVP